MSAPYIPRADTFPSCKNASVVPSILGLNYTIFCDSDLPGHDLDDIICDSFELCIEECTRHHPSCYGVTYDQNQKCLFKGQGIGSTPPVPSPNATSAIADPKAFAQDPRDMWCPFPNLSTQRLTEEKGGLEYKVLCGGVFTAGDDLYSMGGTALLEFRAKSLEECVENCVKIHPFCSHVTWRADWNGGFMNCYPKRPSTQKPILSAFHMTHSAVLKVPTLDNPKKCNNGETKVVGEGDGEKRFKVSCSDRRGDLGMASTAVGVSHEKTVGNCISKCGGSGADSHLNQILKCVAAVFDVGLQSGYMNCYLYESIPPPGGAHANYTFVYLENLEQEFRPPPPAPKNGGHEARVASIVVPVLIVALGSLGWLLWQRKQKRCKDYVTISQANLTES